MRQYLNRLLCRTIVCILPVFCQVGWAAFTDVTISSGISYIHSATKGSAEYNHAGAAAVDVDGDGLTDLLFAKLNAAPLLYMNQGNGQFSNEASARGLSSAVDAAAFGAGDFDNDGDSDLFIVPHSGNRFFLYINDGTGNFVEDAVARGSDVTVSLNPHKGYSVGLVDYNLDGFLDVYVSESGVVDLTESASHSVLLRNVGADSPGHFVVVTSEAGLVQAGSGGMQYGRSSSWADFDSDGWPDLALIADEGNSKMYWNDGDGSFTEATSLAGIGFEENGAGVAVADYDGDGLLDLYVTSVFDEFAFKEGASVTGNKLYKNMGGRNFQEVSVPVGVSRSGWSWGAAFLEFDNDGNFDLVATNGMHIAENGDISTTPFVAAATDPTTLFLNASNGVFSDHTFQSGLMDTKYGKSVVVLDFDNDGDEDLVVANSFSQPAIYRNDASESSNDWIRFTFEGTVSNRDAFGALVKVTEAGKTQTLYYNPSNAYIGQREAALHFGLGNSDGTIDSVEIKWPTGFTRTIENVAVNQVLHLVEPDDVPIAPLFTMQPSVAGLFEFGEELRLEVAANGSPPPTFVWEKDGVPIEGAVGNVYSIKRLAPFDAGSYRAVANSAGGKAVSSAVEVELDIDLGERSVARWWNEFMMEAIRRDYPDPTKHSRNLYHVSAAMWDAFWPYEEEGWTKAAPVFHKEEINSRFLGSDRWLAQSEAISHAAYTVLKYRYKASPGSERSLFGFRWLMEELGYDPNFVSVEGDTSAAVGNRIGNAVLEGNFGDGSNELANYEDTSGYVAINSDLQVERSGTTVVDVNRWQPLAFDFAISQNGIPIGALVQKFLGVNWREVETYAMKKTSSNTIAFDPGPPPQFEGDTNEEFIDSAVEIIRYSSYLDPSDETMIDISPGARLNNPVGTNNGTGRPVNPFTGEPYPPNLVKRADYGRILAEFWADGPASETPPGHWNTLHNEITEHPLFKRRYMGVGPELSPLEWDIRAYLALNGGMHDAAVAAWTLKRQYDYSRPITMIRYLGEENRLPEIPGLIERATAESLGPGGKHHHLVQDRFSIGQEVIRVWKGEPDDADDGVGGVGWIWPKDWLPYQRSTFVSPAFAAYVSGHSTFSRSGAEVMTLLTGSPYFPGGMGEFHFPKDEFLEFENGPSEDVTLQWATYYDAADQAGISRLYGGIHVRADDFVGRILGARIGVESFVKTHALRNSTVNGSVLEEAVAVQEMLSLADSKFVRFDAEESSMPVYTVSTMADAKSGELSAIYFVIPEPEGFAETTELKVVTNSDSVRGIVIEGKVSPDDALIVEVTIDSAEPIVALATGESSNLNSIATDTRLVLYKWIDSKWEAIDDNDDWLDHETSSQSEVLLLRKGSDLMLEDNDSALPLVLSSGKYRVVLKGAEAIGDARLSVYGQGWTNSN